MASTPWTVRGLRHSLAIGVLQPSALADLALARSNQNPGRNTYLWQNAAWTRAEADARPGHSPRRRRPLRRWTKRTLGPARLSQRLLRPGRRTHQLRRPLLPRPQRHSRNATLGSFSSSARPARSSPARPTSIRSPTASPGRTLSSVTAFNPATREHSPAAPQAAQSPASLKVLPSPPSVLTRAAPCAFPPPSLASLAIEPRSVVATGAAAAHLAESFDTMGWLFRDLEDAPLLAVPFAGAALPVERPFTRFAAIADAFLHDCEPEIAAGSPQHCPRIGVARPSSPLLRSRLVERVHGNLRPHPGMGGRSPPCRPLST